MHNTIQYSCAGCHLRTDSECQGMDCGHSTAEWNRDSQYPCGLHSRLQSRLRVHGFLVILTVSRDSGVAGGGTRSLVQQCFAFASGVDKSDPTHSCTRTHISGKRSCGTIFKHPPSRNSGYAPAGNMPECSDGFSGTKRQCPHYDGATPRNWLYSR